jgi:hypothetical protein
MSRETAKQDLQAIINAAAEKEGVDPELMQKIGGSESSLVATAKNPKSTAKGLFQFVDKTWAEMGGKPGEQYNPQKNAELGAKYIKKNFEALSSALGREPTYGEVYAAHFFGTTGAKTLLTKADPSAPIEQSLAMFESPKRVQKVLKQNPNLQGKTTGQVLEELNAKMGGSKQPTVMAQEPAAPSAKPSGFFRRPVPRFIRSEAPNLGTGYNAALALMGMSDDDALTTAQETVAQNEEDNAVADFGQAKQMLAGIQAPNAFAKQQPRMLSKGGDVKKTEASERDKQAEKFFDELDTVGKDITVRPSFTTSPAYTAELGVGYQRPPTSVQGKLEAMLPLFDGQAKVGVSGVAVKPENQRLMTMPGELSLGYKRTTGPHSVNVEARRSINAMPTPGGGRGHMYGANVNYAYKFAEGGDVAPEKGSAKAMLKEVGRSTQYLPADIAGSPVDLINLGLKGVDAMTGSKLASEMPVGGAEWIIDKANKYGLMDKPTGSMTETLTRFATGLASPVGVAKGVAMAGNKAATVSRKALDEISELSSASKAKKAADIAEAPPTPAVPTTPPSIAPAYTERVPDAPRGQARSMLDEIDPQIQKLIAEPRAKGFEGPQLPKRELTTPTRERPFVSTLDKFFEQGDKPVTVEQLTNQLAKGTRDYEMNRVNQLLKGKSPKDKVRPSDLLEQLKQTSPARFKVEIKEPDPKNMGQFYSSMENPFPSKPMGTVNLLEDVTPQEKLANQYTSDLYHKEMFKYKSNIYSPEEKDASVKQLEAFFSGPMAREVAGNNLTSSFKRDVPEIRKLNKDLSEMRGDTTIISYPSQSNQYGFDFFQEKNKLLNEFFENNPDIKRNAEGYSKAEKVIDPVVRNKAEEAILAGLDKKYGTKMLEHKQSLGNEWTKRMTSYEKGKVTERMLGDVIGADITASMKRLEALEKPYRDTVAKAYSNKGIYSGQHSGIAKDNPISFSRFQDITLPTKENVMVFPELQSDRFEDLLKKGTKGGSQYQDMDELSNLEQKLDSVTRKIYKAETPQARDELKLEGKKVEQRIINLRERIQAGTYDTPEFLPGIERMPQVMQQLMVKNAVTAGIQRGKNGIILPGSDSKQSQLYEKLPNNIRSVVKDLGPGFEMRKVPLKYEDGSTIERYGIFWKDDAAKRIDKEGVRFKNGGMVDKNDDENQKYI